MDYWQSTPSTNNFIIILVVAIVIIGIIILLICVFNSNDNNNDMNNNVDEDEIIDNSLVYNPRKIKDLSLASVEELIPPSHNNKQKHKYEIFSKEELEEINKTIKKELCNESDKSDKSEATDLLGDLSQGGVSDSSDLFESRNDKEELVDYSGGTTDNELSDSLDEDNSNYFQGGKIEVITAPGETRTDIHNENSITNPASMLSDFSSVETERSMKNIRTKKKKIRTDPFENFNQYKK